MATWQSFVVACDVITGGGGLGLWTMRHKLMMVEGDSVEGGLYLSEQPQVGNAPFATTSSYYSSRDDWYPAAGGGQCDVQRVQ